MSFELNFIRLTKKDFKKKIKDHRMALVEFKAEWSGGSHILEPIIEKLAIAYRKRLCFFRVDAERNRDIIEDFGIDQYPTLLLFNRGSLVDKISGIRPVQEIKERIDQQLTQNL
ncbi:MAG: thioredoxin family protein [Cytophagales bacterium]|nr:thioredoxin family protein [Cytophagales bacterium]